MPVARGMMAAMSGLAAFLVMLALFCIAYAGLARQRTPGETDADHRRNRKSADEVGGAGLVMLAIGVSLGVALAIVGMVG